MTEPKTIMINDVKYVREDSIIIPLNYEENLMSCMIGKNVIIRSYNDGVNCGTLVAADETGVILKNCRRLWYHKPKDSSTAWYEGVAMTGISSDSKVSCTVDQKIIVEKYSIVSITEDAYKSIMEKNPHES